MLDSIQFQKHTHYDKEIEQAVIGAVLLFKNAIGTVATMLKPDHFYFETHKKIYEAILEMFNATIPIDILTVREWIINKKNLRVFPEGEVGYYLTVTTNSVLSPAHVSYHCHILHEQWQRRAIMSARFHDLDAFNTNPLEQGQSLLNRISDVLGRNADFEWKSMDQLMYNLLKHQYDLMEGNVSYITTGFKSLDQLNGGFSVGDLVIIGARPSIGKSALMSEMVLQIARKGHKVGIISLEMADLQISARLAAIEANMPFKTVFRDIAEDVNQMRAFYDVISRETINLPIYVSDNAKVNITEIRARAMKLKDRVGLDVLFIDYLQLIDGKSSNKNYNRENEVSQISRGLKILAKELGIPVIALCQLNREVTNRTYDKRFPKLSDLRESGSIEQDADVVLFIHRDWKMGFTENPDGSSTENEADLIVAKWRNGSSDTVIKLDFDGEKMLFKERSRFTSLNNITYTPVKIDNEDDDDNPF